MDQLTEKSAKLGFANSQVYMGNKCLSKGNNKDAYQWFSRAVLQRHPVAAFQLAWMHQQGIGCEGNVTLACEGFRSLTELGQGPNLSIAYFPLYLCYRQLGQNKNANDILLRGLRNDSVECTRILAVNDFKNGNMDQSYQLFKKASDMGDFYSSYHAAIFPGQERNIPLLRYSSQGYWRGSKTMAIMIMKGMILGSWSDALDYHRNAYDLIPSDHPEKNYLEWIIWWMEISFGKGEFGLDFLEYGTLPKIPSNHPLDEAWRCLDTLDFVGASKSFLACVEIGEGIGEATFNIGFMYIFGLGTEKNFIKAHEYLSQAMIDFARDVDENLHLMEVVEGIRNLMEKNPENWPMLLEVYQTEGNEIKTSQLREKLENKN